MRTCSRSSCRVHSTSFGLDAFPSPDDLWARYRAWKGLTPEAEAVVLQDYFDDGSGKAPRYYVEGTYFRSRIGDNFRRATRAWFEEGRAEGIEEGLEQQRVLLGRQAATKFGVKASTRVEPLLAQIADPALLAEIGEGLLVCATETEFVARIEAIMESKALPPGH